MTMTRDDVTKKIIATKVSKGIKWADAAKKIGLSKEFCTTVLLGQGVLTPAEAKKAAKVFGLNAEETKWLSVVPYRGGLPTAVPTDPLIYRFYELLQTNGLAIKALIEEEFGDGIMSAIDFTMDIQREPDPKGDRVHIVMSGKFLGYKRA
jgi:cyanate lyase